MKVETVRLPQSLAMRPRADWRKGKRDGKRVPSARRTSVEAIASEEEFHEHELERALNLALKEVGAKIRSADNEVDELHREIDSQEHLLGPVTSRLVCVGASIAAVVLIAAALADGAGVGAMFVKVFGSSSLYVTMLPAFVLAVLGVLGVVWFYQNATPYRRIVLGYAGVTMCVLGYVGVSIIRTGVFMRELSDHNRPSDSIIWLCMALLTLCLSIGGPIIIGILLERTLRLLHVARLSARLHQQMAAVLKVQEKLRSTEEQLIASRESLGPLLRSRLKIRLSAYENGYRYGLSRFERVNGRAPEFAVGSDEVNFTDRCAAADREGGSSNELR